MRSLVLVGSLLAAAPALAKSVYINGSKVDGAVNIKLNSVDVEIDAAGDVHITAKNYKVEVQEAQPALTKLTRRYYLTASAHGEPGWTIDVYVGGAFVKRYRSRDADPAFEITQWLHGGENSVRFRATKDNGDRSSVSPSDFLEITLGEGQTRGAQLVMEPLYSYRRTAAETGLMSSDTTLTAH
jgi:hypothetical protein